ncbi:hypothetical protein K8942_05955 [Candidatus Peribacteria bacterium]|nr:MAG: hypothetical protein K8942_05955 [Candidatus Peribacteria bacterium]
MSTLRKMATNGINVLQENAAALMVWGVIILCVGGLGAAMNSIIKEGNQNKEADYRADVFVLTENGVHTVGFPPPKFISTNDQQKMLLEKIDQMFEGQMVAVVPVTIKDMGACAIVHPVKKMQKKMASR